MTDVEIVGDRLVVTPLGWHRWLTFKRRIDLPLASVRAVRADPNRSLEAGGLRAPGARLPRKLTAGTYYRQGRKSFWDVRDPARMITIELAGTNYDELVIEVADPAGTVAAIRQATGV